MKKILAAAIVTLAALVGCTSPGDQLCAEVETCAGNDPAEECNDDEELDEDEQACADACQTVNEAYAQCAVDNGKCEDEVWTVEAADCEAELEAFSECFTDNCT